MKIPQIRLPHLITTTFLVLCLMLLQQPAHASPFGQGLFGEDVPFGGYTSIDLSVGSNVNVNLTPAGGGTFTGQGSHTTTVTSSDVVGHYLYVYAPTTDLSNGSDTIAASGNSSPAALSTNTWGYNTSGSTTNYVGMTSSPVEIEDFVGPDTVGHDTDVYYGVYVDITKPADSYTTTVYYTVAAKFDTN